MKLLEWCRDGSNQPDASLLYKEAMWSSVIFMRDTLTYKMLNGIPIESFEVPQLETKRVRMTTVVGEHRSKSIKLPVVSIMREDLGLEIIMRDNFHDFNVTVRSRVPVASSVMEGFEKEFSEPEVERYNSFTQGSYWGYCFFQGFPVDAMRGPWSLDATNFSLCLNNSYETYAFVHGLINWRLAQAG